MIKNNLCIIDDFLDNKDFDELSKIVLGPKFPWFYGEHVSISPLDAETIKDPLATETWGFHHITYDKEWDIKSYTYNALQSFFQKVERELGFTQRHLIRARFSVKFQKQGFTQAGFYSSLFYK